MNDEGMISIAAWLIAALAAIGLAGSVYAIPIQVSEVVEIVERVQPLPSASAAFHNALFDSRTKVRPLRYVQTWWLLKTAGAIGGRYHLVFRGYHALLAALLIFLFTVVMRVRAWTDVWALAFGLTVLLGTHTFVGMVREAYPVNHFLLIAVLGLATLAIAQTRGGWLADTTAVVLFAIAVLTLESGLLLVPIAFAAYVAGARGISRGALIALVLVVIAYGALRVGYLGIQNEGLGAAATGLGTRTLSGDEQVARFSGNPMPLYVYTSTMAATSVLLSQPTLGRWTLVETWQQGEIPTVYLLQTISSLATTLLIVWFLVSRSEDGRRRWREPVPFVFLVVLVANAVISYAYAKDEVVSIAGVFYALAAFASVRSILARTRPLKYALPLAMVMIALSSAWAIRSVGLHYKLRHGAFEARTEWAAVLRPAHPDTWPQDVGVRTVVARMKEDAIRRRVFAPHFFPRGYEDLWGED